MKNIFFAAISLFFMLCASSSAFATETTEQSTDRVTAQSTDKIKVSAAWARPANAGANSAAYMIIENVTSYQVQIIGATAPTVANNTELHSTSVDKGVAKMCAIENLVIPAQSKVELSPGKLHVMLMDLVRDLKMGDEIEIVLALSEQVKPVVVKAVVGKSAPSPSAPK